MTCLHSNNLILDLLRAEDVEQHGGLHRRVPDERRFKRQK